MRFFQPKSRLQFLCEPADLDVIARPVPAKAYLPDWFRKLSAADSARMSKTEPIAIPPG